MEPRGRPLASPGAPGVSAPGPSPAREVTPGRSIKTFIFVSMLLVLLEPATSARAYPPAALRKMELSLTEGLCHAGYYRADETGACEQCQDGVDYTNHSNNLSSCIPCSICRDDKEKKSPCTTTRDAECQCKPGTFQDQESPEFCQKCTTRCHNGMVEESPCVPWSDLKCVHKESAYEVSPYVLLVVLFVTSIVIVAVAVFVWKSQVWRNILTCLKNIRPSCEQDSRHLSTVGTPEAQDNDHNEILSSRNSASTLDLEQQRNEQVTGVTEEFPEEGTSLLRPAETETSPMRRRPLIPANGTDTVETLREFFSFHQDIIPCRSWDKLMRLMGLTDNEIYMIKRGTQNPEDTLYEMMVKWLNKMGRQASINTLLDALERLGERNARENIEDYMVKSGKFIYQEDGADPAESFP